LFVVVAAVCAQASAPASARAFQQLPVDELVAAASLGDYTVRDTLSRVASECTAEPDDWRRAVLAELVARPLDLLGYGLRIIVPAVASVSRDCRDLGVQSWVRDALDMDVPELFYREMLAGLNEAGLVGYRALSEVAEDPDADPRHRIWVTEALLKRSTARARDEIAELPSRLALHFGYNGLPAAYVETWLPMLLAAVETREAAAQQLIGVANRLPDMEGASEIIRIVGADVEAYQFRFSPETRGRVRAALEDLARRPDLLPDIGRAVRETMLARSSGLNHEGVQVRPQPLMVDVRAQGNGCTVEWPAVMARVIEAAAPGFRVTPRQDDCRGAVRAADFNGDGLQDALVRGASGGRTLLLAVIAGASASAHVVEELGGNDYAVVASPGIFTPACGAVGPQIFPNEYIWVSYDEKSTANFRFDGTRFERLLGDAC
jgi:hypothetical protein